MQNIQIVFPEGKRKAFTVSYDDGAIQDKRLVGLMNHYGIKGTFNLCADFFGVKTDTLPDGRFIPEEEVTSIYDGQEIAGHTLSHMKLTDISTEVVAYQLIEGRRRLERLTEKIVSGFAYPFGFYNAQVLEVLKNCGVDYARTTIPTGKFDLPEDFLQWHPTCHHDDENLFVLMDRFFGKSVFPGFPEVFYLWGHSFEFDQKGNWDRIEKVFQQINEKRDMLWIASNGEIVHYINSFRKLKYSVDGELIYNPTDTDIWVSFDDRILEIPKGGQIHR